MTEEQAKLLLSVHRPGASAPHDSTVEEALAMVASDPNLRAWYESEQECIAAFDAKFGEIAPPANLRARILAADSTGSPSVPWFRRRAFLATAAVLILSLLGATVWLKRPFTSGGTSLAAYQLDMATFLDRFFLLDYESEKIADVTGWLEREQGVKNFAIPRSLAAHPSLGCEVIPWNGRLTYLICFDVDGELYHLFLLPGGAQLSSPSGDLNQYEIDPKWASASWTDGNDLYFCCALEEQERFRRVLDRPVRSTPDSPSPTEIDPNPHFNML